MFKPKVYLGVRMTHRFCDELLKESAEVSQKLEKAGFEVLSPVIEEGVPNKHVRLVNTLGRLKGYWKRDKQMLNEAHIMMDYMSQGKSDGVNVEMGYVRFLMWKPLIRIHPTLGCTISRLEYDCVTDNLEEAIKVMQTKWGTKQKLRIWRLKMLNSSVFKFIKQQIYFLWELL